MITSDKLLTRYNTEHTPVIRQAWGQTPESLYGQLFDFFTGNKSSKYAAIVTYKHYGLKQIIQFLQSHSVECEIVGKGTDNMRIIECTPRSGATLQPLVTSRMIEFIYEEKQYRAETSGALFSPKSLDKGTKTLLDHLLRVKEELNEKKIADLGAGWGAISIVLADRISTAQFVAFETDTASIRCAESNAKEYENIQVVSSDLCDAKSISDYRQIFDVAVSNPPFHMTEKQRFIFIQNAWVILKQGGVFYLVAESSFAERFKKTSESLFKVSAANVDNRFIILTCQK